MLLVLVLLVLMSQAKTTNWVVCSTPHALIPDTCSPHTLSPHTLSPCALSPRVLSPNGLRKILKNEVSQRENFNGSKSKTVFLTSFIKGNRT